MNNHTIRIAKMADVTAIRDLVHRVIDQCYTSPEYPVECTDFMKKHHSLEKIAKDITEEYVVVAEIDDKMVATGALSGTEIYRVYIEQSCQGSGLGKKIMAQLEEKAKQNGIKEIILASHIPPLGFYKKLGYVITSKESRQLENCTLNFYRTKKIL